MNFEVQAIPIRAEGKALIPHAAELVWGVMNYPQSVYTAFEFHYCCSINKRIQHDPNAQRPTRGFELFTHDFERRSGRANVAGLMTLTAIGLHRNGHTATKRRCAQLISQYAAEFDEQQRRGGKGRRKGEFPSDVRDIEKAFNEYADCAHLWAAFQAGRLDWLEICNNETELRYFLHAANMLSSELTLALPGFMRCPWLAEQALIEDIQGGIFVHEIDPKYLEITRNG